MESIPTFDVTNAAIDALDTQFQDKEILLVYENITHDGGDEIESDVYHLYVFTMEHDNLQYYTSSYEKRYVPSDKLCYPPVNGIQLDQTLPRVYLEGIMKKVQTYFEYDPEHTYANLVINYIDKIIELSVT